MAVRPVDHTTLISKTQELSQLKQVETKKNEIQIQQNFNHEQNKIEKDLKRVCNLNKSEKSNIGINDKQKERNNPNNQKKKKKSEKNLM